MVDLEAEFERASREVHELPERPSNEELLELYALFKQGSVGDVQGKRPGLVDFKGRLKYDAWAALKGMDRDEARRAYVALVRNLTDAYASRG